MSGHSKWANIKRRKSAVDIQRGKVFTKIARELQVAARAGGSDPDMNIRLRLVLDKAKAANMPKDNIERAIARGAGTEKGVDLEEITYEGYANNGIAVMVDVSLDQIVGQTLQHHDPIKNAVKDAEPPVRRDHSSRREFGTQPHV